MVRPSSFFIVIGAVLWWQWGPTVARRSDRCPPDASVCSIVGDVYIEGNVGAINSYISNPGRGGLHLIVGSVTVDGNVGPINSGSFVGGGDHQLYFLVQYGRVRQIRAFIDSGTVDVNEKDNEGRTLLSFAAESGRLEIVKMLVDTERVEIDGKDTKGRTPFSYAAERGHLEVAKTLLDTGKVDVDATDNQGISPLSYATSEDIVKLIEDYQFIVR